MDFSQRPFRYWREIEDEQEPKRYRDGSLPWCGISAFAVRDGAVPIFR